MKFLRDNWSFLIIITLIVIIFLQRCQKPAVIVKQDTRDTVINKTYYIKGGDTTIIKPIVRQTSVPEVQIVHDTSNIAALVKQIEYLTQQINTINKYRDTLKIDTLGTAVLEETIQNNKIAQRSIKYSLKIPVVEKTITNIIYEKPKNKWFFGGAIGGNKVSFVNQFEVNLLLLNKKDKLFQVGTQIDVNGLIGYKIGTYWKL